MGSRAARSPLTRGPVARVGLALTALSLAHCAGQAPAPYAVPELPTVVAKPAPLPASAPPISASAPPLTASSALPEPPGDAGIPSATPSGDADTDAGAEPAPVATDPPAEAPVHCASAPALLPDGAVPPVPPHAPLGHDVDIPDDRPAYVLPGNAGDSRVIVYLHGMCGDATAADFFREAVRAHGTLIAVRGDTSCPNGRFKWRDDASKIQTRIRAAFKRVNALVGGTLDLDHALLFGYSQGAERAERVAALYPKQYPRIVLGGPPTKASPERLGRVQRVAILGGELETTENMRTGHVALVTAGILSRFFTLDCAYHGYFGEHAESQLTEVLDWVSAP